VASLCRWAVRHDLLDAGASGSNLLEIGVRPATGIRHHCLHDDG
jgi:hypothetical protein